MRHDKMLLLLVTAALTGLVACSGTTGSTDAGNPSDGGTVADAGTHADAGARSDAGDHGDAGDRSDAGDQPDAGTTTNPPQPSLGTQIDRTGRPGITTTQISPFTDAATHDAATDAYNVAAPAAWAGFIPAIRASLGVYDALNQVCGDQLLADAAAPRYITLATVISQDALLVNSATGTCTQYLGVELQGTGLATDGGCGGRTPTMDVIDTTYSELALGATTGVTDGVAADPDGVPSTTAFPFLRAP